ncbi:hypothetical protein IT417_02145, partial [bacterium]|nr:hypothetical protein [bacterium]
MKISVLIKKVLKTAISWGVILFFLWLLYRSAGDYQKILNTIREADYVLLGWGVLLAMGNLSVTTMIFRSNFAIFAQTVNLGKLLPEIIINSFVTISNPL